MSPVRSRLCAAGIGCAWSRIADQKSAGRRSTCSIVPPIAAKAFVLPNTSGSGSITAIQYLECRDHPSPGQCKHAIFKRTRFSAVKHHSPGQRRFALQIFTEGANAGCVAGRHLTARLDFESHELTGFFQDEIHFVSCTVTPEMQFALPGIERSPGLQCLKQGLLQPESTVHSGCHLGGRSDSSKPGSKPAICPKQLRRIDQRSRGISRQRTEARDHASGFQQIQIPVCGRVTEGTLPNEKDVLPDSIPPEAPLSPAWAKCLPAVFPITPLPDLFNWYRQNLLGRNASTDASWPSALPSMTQLPSRSFPKTPR
jgi:hypothetical protein